MQTHVRNWAISLVPLLVEKLKIQLELNLPNILNFPQHVSIDWIFTNEKKFAENIAHREESNIQCMFKIWWFFLQGTFFHSSCRRKAGVLSILQHNKPVYNVKCEVFLSQWQKAVEMLNFPFTQPLHDIMRRIFTMLKKASFISVS